MTTALLPIPTTSFVGRSNELARIAALFADPNCRLLTLLGPGGIGKTRLALQFAADQRSFTDGVYFVHLTPVSSLDLVPSAIASALQITLFDSIDLRPQLAEYLREKYLLLVMDNFEHLLEGVDLLIDLLQAAPQVKFLVTSRERLNLQEEWVLALDGLSFPENTALLPLESYSAVQLFAQRARQMQTNFLLDENAEAVRKICQQVEGMPLGLELAATWLRAMNPQQITAHMESNLGFLTTPLRNVAERHRSLYRVFEQSWKLLLTDEQNVLMRLSVFRGGFDLEAAQQVAGASLAILAGLADKSLIRVNREGRYDLHELLRQFAEGQLEAAGATEATRSSHSAYYLRFMERHDDDLKGRRQQAGLHEIRSDLENIQAGWQWAIDHEQHTLITTPVLDCLMNFAEMSNRLIEVRKLLKQAEAAQVAKLADQAAIRGLRIQSIMGMKTDYQHLEIILERIRQRGDKRDLAYCLWVLGDYHSLYRDFANKLHRYDESLRLWREVGDAFYIAHLLNGLSGDYYNTNRSKEAIELLNESVQIRYRIGDLSNLAYALLVLSYLYILEGRLSDGAQLQDQALDIHNEIGPIASYPIIKAAKATWGFWGGEFESAMDEIQEAEHFANGQIYRTSTNLDALRSLVKCMRGDYRQAYDLIQQHLRSSTSFTPEWSQFGLAVAVCGLGENERAWRALYDMLTIAPSAISHTWQRQCLPIAAILAARANQAEWAAELLGLAFAGPHELIGWMEKWPLLNEVRQQLEDQLGAEVFRNAWEHGQTLQLDVVARTLLEHSKHFIDHGQPSASEVANRSLLEPLSERELDVLRLIAAGHSNQDIADHLVISVTTVKKHINHIFGKLGVESRTQAIAHAQSLNIL